MNSASTAPESTGRPGACVYSIGHSRHPAEHFLSLLRAAQITLLADVRSQPVSRWSPHFAGAALERQLRALGIGYAFLGTELGGRPRGAEYYGADGALDCARRAGSPEFQQGIARLLELAQRQRTVLLCAEEDPRWCHRRRLITPVLLRAGVSVVHLRGDGRRQTEAELEAASAQLDLFR